MLTSTDAREMIRHAINRLRLNFALDGYRRVMGRGQNIAHLAEPTRAGRFSAIYDNAAWRTAKTAGSLSGWGSDLEHTASLRGHLPALLVQLETRTLLDIGCGDFNWMKEIPIDVNYIGMDIVPSIIVTNTALYASEKRRFFVGDAVAEMLPKADTVLCRAVLFHLSFRDICSAISNIKASGATYLLATTDNDVNFNADIQSGDYRKLNLRKRPFRFPEPLLSVTDDRGGSTARTLSAWRTAEITG